MRFRWPQGVSCLLVVLVGACSGDAGRPTTSAPGSSPVSPTSSSPFIQFQTRMVNVGGYKLAVYCEGSGEPAVVFEGGIVGPQESADYSVVVGYMASHHFNRACWYDRAGLGKSDPRPEKRFDALDVVADLHTLVHGIGLHPPYILAGGSIGGFFVRVYWARYPNEVGGMMLIDAAEEHDPRITLGSDWLPQGGSLLSVRKTVAEVRGSGSLDHLPLMVITAGESAGDPTWMHGQRALAGLSDNSVHVVAQGATHGVTDQVPGLVTKLARELVTAANTHTPLPTCTSDLRSLHGRCVHSPA